MAVAFDALRVKVAQRMDAYQVIASVIFNGDPFTVSFDERPLFDVVDATFTQASKVGLWTEADSVAHFDGFKILER